MSEVFESNPKPKWTRINDNLSKIIVNTYLFSSLTTEQIIEEFNIDRGTLYAHIRKQGFEPCRNPKSGNRINHEHNRRKDRKEGQA